MRAKKRTETGWRVWYFPPRDRAAAARRGDVAPAKHFLTDYPGCAQLDVLLHLRSEDVWLRAARRVVALAEDTPSHHQVPGCEAHLQSALGASASAVYGCYPCVRLRHRFHGGAHRCSRMAARARPAHMCGTSDGDRARHEHDLDGWRRRRGCLLRWSWRRRRRRRRRRRLKLDQLRPSRPGCQGAAAAQWWCSWRG